MPKRASPLMMKSYFSEMPKKETLHVNDAHPLSASEVFGTTVALLPGVVCMLPQHKDSSSGDFPQKIVGVSC